jgi:ATP citrate (pro-S)-lyase
VLFQDHADVIRFVRYVDRWASSNFDVSDACQGDWIYFTHEGGVDVGDVDAKAEKLLVPVDLSKYPSNEEIAKSLLKKVPKGVHNVLVDFIARLYAVYVDCQFTYVEPWTI